MLFFISMVVFGNEFAFNNPQALEVNMEKDLNIGETQFQLFYTIFAFPNIFTTFFIGFLIDYIGPRIGLICLTIGMVVFQTVIAIGGYTYSYSTILIGRMLFGIVGQSTITALSCFVAQWFKGKELSMAFGIAVTFPEFGNALNSLVTPLIYEKTQSLGTPLLFSVFICFISFLCALVAAYIDRYADNVIL